MIHKGTQIIHTKRLVLRPFVFTDAPAMYHNWANDPEVTRYLKWPAHPNIAITERVITIWQKKYENIGYYQWAIVDLHRGEAIGSIGVVNQREETECMEIGYCLGRAFWHQGIMSEALEAVIHYLLEEVGARRLEAIHDTRNIYSGQVMIKCGMQPEGVLRQYGKNQQGICDVAIYSILALS